MIDETPRATRDPVLRLGGSGRRAVVIALASTAVVFGLIGWVVVNSPGWAQVQRSFLDWDNFVESAPRIIARFEVNVRLFLIAEALILVLGLVLAVLRGLPGPVMYPIRLLATIWVDVFRAVPGVLVIYLLGFGIPGLRLPGVPNDPFFWGVVALTLVYSAYVSEVTARGSSRSIPARRRPPGRSD